MSKGHVVVPLGIRPSDDLPLLVGHLSVMTFRSLATTARKSLRIGLIPADGIGREVIPVSGSFGCIFSSILFSAMQAARRTLEALGSTLPKLEFHDLLAGFDLFTRTGTALPRETVEYVWLSRVKARG
jgi:hypothetical protein